MQWLCPASFVAPHCSPHHNQSGLVFLHLGRLWATENTSTPSLKALVTPPLFLLILLPQPHWSQSCSLNMEGALYGLASSTPALFPRLLSGSHSYLPAPVGSVAPTAAWTTLYLDFMAFLLTDLFTFLRAKNNCSAGCRHPIKAGYTHNETRATRPLKTGQKIQILSQASWPRPTVSASREAEAGPSQG